MLSERCGSLPYVAPEVRLSYPFNFHDSTVIQLNSNAPYHAEPIDVWGVGVILFTLLVGSMSFIYLLLFSSQIKLIPHPLIDTPWDEPTIKSPEFCRYVSGTIFSEAPWNRIPSEALCEL